MGVLFCTRDAWLASLCTHIVAFLGPSIARASGGEHTLPLLMLVLE
ncbi:hypothetical protein [Klebsiella pneumoniae]|nr:hypothetical protein [Klebsiella pneumoniae]